MALGSRSNAEWWGELGEKNLGGAEKMGLGQSLPGLTKKPGRAFGKPGGSAWLRIHGGQVHDWLCKTNCSYITMPRNEGEHRRLVPQTWWTDSGTHCHNREYPQKTNIPGRWGRGGAGG